MTMPAHAIKLSEADCKLLESLINTYPKTGIELLLVASGVKTGDIISNNFLLNINNVKKALRKTVSELDSNNIQLEEFESGDLIFYNKLVDKELLESVRIMFKEDTLDSTTIGLFYGFPLCCSIAYEEGRALEYIKPFTEHRWCAEDCKESMRLVELYKEAISINLPEYKPLLERLSKLVNHSREYQLFINELMTKVKESD